MNTSFYDYTLKNLEQLFALHNLPASGPGRLFNWHYKQQRAAPCTEQLAKASQNYINENLHFDLPEIDISQESDDGSVKFLMKLSDGKKIETVLISSANRYKICLSSQVGCAMKCSFCYTGTQGLSRHLKTYEIVGQYLVAQRWLSEHRPGDDRIGTIVFMGQGEPLHNFDAVKEACEIFLSQHGLSLAEDKITISTAGYLPGLKRWAAEMPKVNLALSLHSVDAEKRSELIPINEKYPLDEVLKVIDDIPRGKKRFIVFEYLLTKGFNDSLLDAQDLGKKLQGKKAFVNLIPFNPFPGSKYLRPEQHEVESFKKILDEMGIPTLVRFTKGDDILAACGQLNSKFENF